MDLGLTSRTFALIALALEKANPRAASRELCAGREGHDSSLKYPIVPPVRLNIPEKPLL